MRENCITMDYEISKEVLNAFQYIVGDHDTLKGIGEREHINQWLKGWSVFFFFFDSSLSAVAMSRAPVQMRQKIMRVNNDTRKALAFQLRWLSFSQLSTLISWERPEKSSNYMLVEKKKFIQFVIQSLN